MAPARPPTETRASSAQGLTWARALILAGAVGAAVAIVIVYAYYNDPWRPLAHSLGLWALLASAVGFRRPPALAIGASIASLAAAVITYFVGLKVGHDIRWSGSGSVMFVNWGDIQLWLVLAVPAGVVFGLLGSFAPRTDWRGAAATATLLGLLLGDAYRRYSNWGGFDAAVTVDVIAAIAVFLIASKFNRRPLLTLGLTVATAVLGLLVVSAPDFIQQVLIEGF